MNNKLISTVIKSRTVSLHYRILVLFALSICLMSCTNWILDNPSFTLRKVSLSPISFTEINLILDLDVQNPNHFDLKLRSFEYTVYLKNEEIGNGHMEKELLIPSSSTTQIQVPLVAKFKDLSGSIKTIFTGNDLPYKIEGTADVSTVLRNHKFTFSKEGLINLKN
ncbi:MAG: LEA type 2 family protein [Smithella sp.]